MCWSTYLSLHLYAWHVYMIIHICICVYFFVHSAWAYVAIHLHRISVDVTFCLQRCDCWRQGSCHWSMEMILALEFTCAPRTAWLRTTGPVGGSCVGWKCQTWLEKTQAHSCNLPGQSAQWWLMIASCLSVDLKVPGGRERDCRSLVLADPRLPAGWSSDGAPHDPGWPRFVPGLCHGTQWLSWGCPVVARPDESWLCKNY